MWLYTIPCNSPGVYSSLTLAYTWNNEVFFRKIWGNKNIHRIFLNILRIFLNYFKSTLYNLLLNISQIKCGIFSLIFFMFITGGFLSEWEQIFQGRITLVQKYHATKLLWTTKSSNQTKNFKVFKHLIYYMDFPFTKSSNFIAFTIIHNICIVFV